MGSERLKNKFKYHVALSLVAVAVLSLTSCAKKDAATGGDNAQGSASADENLAAKYVNIIGDTDGAAGKQLTYLYYALSGEQPDYDKIAQQYWQDYRNTSDAFQKQAMLKTIVPQIDASINSAKKERYIAFKPHVDIITNGTNDGILDLTHYTLSNGYFGYSFFKGNSDYSGLYCTNCNDFANFAKFSFFSDESHEKELIKKISSTRSWSVKVYGHADGSGVNGMGFQYIKVKIDHLQLIAKDGTILATYPEK